MQLRKFILTFFLLISFFSPGQSSNTKEIEINRDSKYLEDQIFFNFSYISLTNLCEGIRQQGFSNSVSFGFIRDIPLNVRRNIGFGLGIGYERSVYFQNLRIKVNESDGSIQYEILDPAQYRLNNFGIKRLIVPLEIRLRGSSATKFSFWRFYAGITLGYTLGAFSDFEDQNISLRYKNLGNIPSKYHYGVHVYAGYGELNGYIYFGLNDLFSPEVKINDNHIPLQDLRFGIMLSFL